MYDLSKMELKLEKDFYVKPTLNDHRCITNNQFGIMVKPPGKKLGDCEF